MVMGEWNKILLAQIGDFSKGVGISRAESQTGDIPAVRYGELYTVHNNYVRSFVSQISRDVADRAKRVHYGDILFACSGETKEDIAKCAAIVHDIEVYVGGDIIIFSPRINVDPIFMGFMLNTPEVVKQKSQKAQGDAVVHISTESLKSIEISIPEYEEQVRIAAVLSNIDELTVQMEALITKKKAIKQGAMQELLTGKKRLPGFNEEWMKIKIGSMAEVYSGGTPNTSEPAFWGGKIPWMNSGELNLKIVRQVQGRITKAGMESSSTHFIPAECVLIGLAGQGKTRGTAAFNTFPLCTNQSIAAIYPNPDKFNSKFLYYKMDTQYEKLRELSSGDGGRGGLNKKLILDYVVYIPSSVVEQNAIASILTEMDNELENLEEKLAKYRQIKQGMMQQLLTGKIRLVD